MEIELDTQRQRQPGEEYVPRSVEYLQRAYEQTITATSEPNKWQGTTTAAGAQLHCRKSPSDSSISPVLYITNLGDSQILVLRPEEKKVLFKTTEQWHWFDCPRQLGTNSPDTPRDNAVVDEIEIRENDVVLAMSDGVIDNLWEHEIVENVVTSIRKWEEGIGLKAEREGADGLGDEGRRNGAGGMKYVAEQLMHAARVIAQDPFAESPFMEHAVEEGLAMEGGKCYGLISLPVTDVIIQASLTISVLLLPSVERTQGEIYWHERCHIRHKDPSTRKSLPHWQVSSCRDVSPESCHSFYAQRK